MSSQQSRNPEDITWPTLLATAAVTVAATAEGAPQAWFGQSSFREALAEAAAAGAGLASSTQALCSGASSTQLHLDGILTEKRAQLATALSAAFSAARVLLEQSPGAEVAAERVAFVGIGLQVLHNSNLPPNTAAAREFLTAVLTYGPNVGAAMPQTGTDGGSDGNSSAGLAASVVANLAGSIKTLSFDSSEGTSARLQALALTVMSIGAAAPCDGGSTAQLGAESHEGSGGEQPPCEEVTFGDGNIVRQQCLQVWRPPHIDHPI